MKARVLWRSLLRRLPVHSLFLKIFLWFWLAMTVAGMALVASDSGRVQQSRQSWRRMTGEAFSVYADSAADAHEDEQAWESKEYLADLEKRTGIRAWLLDGQGREVSGYAPQKRRAHWSQMQQLVARARRSGQTEFEPLGNVTLAAREATPLNGHHYVLAGELPAARFGLREAEPHIQALRLLTILLLSGVVCWGLGRYLTKPIVTLREATQQLAAGDLAARAGTALSGRRDELAGLSRDFDRMAERMQALLEEQERLMRAQRRLLGDVSHELRSPLTRVGIAVELAREHLAADDRDAVADTLNRIERESGRQAEMIDRLLALARLESGLVERGTDAVDVAALLRAVAADADYEARPHRRTVCVTHCDGCTTTGTPDLLRSALENVVRNAVLYTAKDSEVEVSLRHESDGMALIRVLDRGPGVPETELRDIFRPFHRAESARDRTRGGTGLGLTITARAVELHGGTIEANNAPQGGLVIEIRLPASAT